MIEHVGSTRVKTMYWPDPAEKAAVNTTMLEDDATAKKAAKLWARKMSSMAECGTWMWWADPPQMDD